jgi:hypothetical protein
MNQNISFLSRWSQRLYPSPKHGTASPLSTVPASPCGFHPMLRPARSREADCETAIEALRKQLKNVHFLKSDYADNTKIKIAGMLRKWKR